MSVRLFFATDVHGSEVCWRKFINSAKHYGANVLILGGDMTGKAVIPIIDNGGGTYTFHMQDIRHDLQGAEALAANRARSGSRLLPRGHDGRGGDRVHQRPRQARGALPRSMRQHCQGLGRVGRRASRGQRHACIVCPGNDDRPDIDGLLATSSQIEVGEGNIVDLPDGIPAGLQRLHEPHALGHPREEDDGQAQGAHQGIVAQATASPEHLVMGLHAPPYDTQLDVAPKIDWETLTVQGQDSAHVGSTAVKEVIEQVQPILSLHGHIHESRAAIRIGRTLAVNPGSSYVEGTLSGCVIELDGKKKIKRYRLTSG